MRTTGGQLEVSHASVAQLVPGNGRPSEVSPDTGINRKLVEPRSAIALGNAQQPTSLQIEEPEEGRICKMTRSRWSGRGLADARPVPHYSLGTPRFSDRKYGSAAFAMSRKPQESSPELPQSELDVVVPPPTAKAREVLEATDNGREDVRVVTDLLQERPGDK